MNVLVAIAVILTGETCSRRPTGPWFLPAMKPVAWGNGVANWDLRGKT